MVLQIIPLNNVDSLPEGNASLLFFRISFSLIYKILRLIVELFFSNVFQSSIFDR